MFNTRVEVIYDKTPKLSAEMSALIAEIVEAAALQCEALAKFLAPADTGFLRSSIQAGPESALIWIVKIGAEYAIFIEFGTVNMSARPFIVPAVEHVRPRFIGQMQNVVSEAARK